MRILVTGANGFLGYYLVKQLLEKAHSVIATGLGECRLPFQEQKNFEYHTLDFTDPYSVHDVFEKTQPGIVVHAGAMGKPDDCELNPMKAYLVNVEGTMQIAINAAECKSFFVFISTDFIFDGDKGMYTEEDAPRPVNYYGRTKMDAEAIVQDYEHDWAIVRTVLVYGKNKTGRNNILTLVQEKLENGEEYTVVDDQVRTPTYVEDLAKGIVSLIEQRATGIYHLSGKDVLTPYKMAILAAEYLGKDKSLIKKATRENFNQPAKRPLHTGFVIQKAENILGFKPISFEEGLRKTFS